MKLHQLTENISNYEKKENSVIKKLFEPITRRLINQFFNWIDIDHSTVHHLDRETAKIDGHDIDTNKIVIIYSQTSRKNNYYKSDDIHNYISKCVRKGQIEENNEMNDLDVFKFIISTDVEILSVEEVIKQSK